MSAAAMDTTSTRAGEALARRDRGEGQAPARHEAHDVAGRPGQADVRAHEVRLHVELPRDVHVAGGGVDRRVRALLRAGGAGAIVAYGRDTAPRLQTGRRAVPPAGPVAPAGVPMSHTASRISPFAVAVVRPSSV